jgi:hypothetical protein
MQSIKIQVDVGALLIELEAIGMPVADSRYDEQVTYHVDLVGSRGGLRITRDRGQHLIGGDENHLRPRGLFRTFDDMIEFRMAVLAYARTLSSLPDTRHW